MRSRLDLHALLAETLGSDYTLYFQPPENIKMRYPAVVYEREHGFIRHADNMAYNMGMNYTLTLISKTADEAAIEKLLALPYTRHTRHFVSDLLHHDTFTIYW